MRIFLGNAPWQKPGFYGVRAGSRWPHLEKEGCGYIPFPFFLAYATTLLRDNGFTPILVDAIAEKIDTDTFFARMKEAKPDIIFFEISTASLRTDLAILEQTRKIFGNDVRIIFAGAHHALGSPEFLRENPNLDFALNGEYEFNLLKLIQSLNDNTPLQDVPNLTYRDAHGDVIKTEHTGELADVDSFPWPARDMLPMENYCDRPGGIPAPSLQLIASRGCPFNCIFCAWPQLMYGGNSYRTRSTRDVVDEIESVTKQFKMKSFYFDDDTFNVGKTRILELCKEIKARNLGLPWAIMARADKMDREILEALKDAGLQALKYGVESGSQTIIDKACKGLDLDKVKESVRITRELGIHYHLTFMFGLPGETFESARETINLALQLDPDSLQFSIATPFPGSRFHDLLLEKGHLMSTNYDEYDGYNNSVVRTATLTPQDLIALRQEAEKTWEAHCLKRAGKAAPAKV